MSSAASLPRNDKTRKYKYCELVARVFGYIIVIDVDREKEDSVRSRFHNPARIWRLAARVPGVTVPGLLASFL